MCKKHTLIGVDTYGVVRCAICLTCLTDEEIKITLKQLGPKNWKEMYKAVLLVKRSARESLGIPESFDSFFDELLFSTNKK